MKNILVVYTSLNKENGNSTKLARQYLDQLRHKKDVTIVEKDLASDNLGHLTQAEMSAWMTPPEERSDAQTKLASVSNEIVSEVQAADEIVLGVPMYNFGIPSVLKAWIDRVARAGITFKYTETGPVGLLSNKKVTILAARGGQYQGSDFDTQSPYLVHFFNFIGLTDVQFVYAEGLNMGEDIAKSAFSKANEKIIELSA